MWRSLPPTFFFDSFPITELTFSTVKGGLGWSGYSMSSGDFQPGGSAGWQPSVVAQLLVEGTSFGGLHLSPPPLFRVATPSHLHLHIGIRHHVGLQLLVHILKLAELLKGKRDAFVARGTEPELFFWIHHMLATGKSIAWTGVWLMKCLAANKVPTFTPNQSAIPLQWWAWGSASCSKKSMVSFLTFFCSVIRSLAPWAPPPRCTTAVPLHRHRQVLPSIPKLVERELMAIDTQQCRESPCLHLLDPTNPDIAIGRRRFVGKEKALLGTSIEGAVQAACDLPSPHQCTGGIPWNGHLDQMDGSFSPKPEQVPMPVWPGWPTLVPRCSHTASSGQHAGGSHPHKWWSNGAAMPALPQVIQAPTSELPWAAHHLEGCQMRCACPTGSLGPPSATLGERPDVWAPGPHALPSSIQLWPHTAPSPHWASASQSKGKTPRPQSSAASLLPKLMVSQVEVWGTACRICGHPHTPCSGLGLGPSPPCFGSRLPRHSDWNPGLPWTSSSTPPWTWPCRDASRPLLPLGLALTRPLFGCRARCQHYPAPPSASPPLASLGWYASSGFTSAEVSLLANRNASAASGWNTNAAWSFLQSLEIWGRESLAEGKDLRIHHTVQDFRAQLQSVLALDEITQARLLMVRRAKWGFCQRVRCQQHSAAWSPYPRRMRHCQRQTLHPPQTCHHAPMWCHSQSQREAKFLSFPPCCKGALSYGWVAPFFPQTHIFSTSVAHSGAQAVKHSGHWWVALDSICLFSLRSTLPTPGRCLPCTWGCFITSSWDFWIFMARYALTTLPKFTSGITSKSQNFTNRSKISSLDKRSTRPFIRLGHRLHGKGDIRQSIGLGFGSPSKNFPLDAESPPPQQCP